jgi:hypothetical protein
MEQPDIVRHDQAITALMPPGTVGCQHGKSISDDLVTDFFRIQRASCCSLHPDPAKSGVGWFQRWAHRGHWETYQAPSAGF